MNPHNETIWQTFYGAYSVVEKFHEQLENDSLLTIKDSEEIRFYFEVKGFISEYTKISQQNHFSP